MQLRQFITSVSFYHCLCSCERNMLITIEKMRRGPYFLYCTSEYVTLVIFVTLLFSFCSCRIIFRVFPWATTTAGQAWSVATTIVSLRLQELFPKWRSWYRRLQAYRLLRAVTEYSFQNKKTTWEFLWLKWVLMVTVNWVSFGTAFKLLDNLVFIAKSKKVKIPDVFCFAIAWMTKRHACKHLHL